MRKTITVCDIHPHEDHEGKERRVGVNGKWVLMDVCDSFMDLVSGAGRPANQPTSVLPAAVRPATKTTTTKTNGKKRGTKLTRVARPAAKKEEASTAKVPCFMCPAPINSPSSFQAHMPLVHGFPTASAAVGKNCPLCNIEHGRLSNHAKEKHGLPHVAHLFAEAIKLDDPHGVVARQRKLGQKVDV